MGEEWHSLRAVGLEFLDVAPKRYVCDAHVKAAPAAIWDALCDAVRWPEWFPGVEEAGCDEAKPGVGSLRWSRVGGVRYEETMLVWDAPERWGYRVDRTSAPVAHAHVEITELSPDGAGTRVRWILATEPAEAIDYMADGQPFGEFLQGLHEEAMAGLERYLLGARDSR